MRNFFYALLIVAIVLASVFIVFNWNTIMAWWNRPQEGDKCILKQAATIGFIEVEGTIKNGICVLENGPEIPDSSGNSNGGNGNSSSQNMLEVSNPNGAPMYYQSLSQASQGMIYGKSNVLIPYGTKLKLIKTWQTNASTQPFSGYYETTYKDYGPTSGFFSTEDVIKL